MRLNITAFYLLVSLNLMRGDSQNQDDNPVRRLRFRRPRPKSLIDINNPEGDEVGPPIPLKRIQGARPQPETSALLEQSIHNPDALQSLLATATQEGNFEEDEDLNAIPRLLFKPAVPSPPQESDIPLEPEATGRRRRPPNVPRRNPSSSRSRSELAHEGEKGQRIPSRPKEEPIKTTDNYSHINPDGSFTFGYVSEDGSFREETRGTDCITRGKYGYVDPDGRKREFTYVSGLPCSEDGDVSSSLGDEPDNNVDPINPNERFRSSNPIQLADSEIPRLSRPRQQLPKVEDDEPQVIRQDPVRLRARPAIPVQTNRNSALQNLFTVASDDEIRKQPTLVNHNPRPTPVPTRIPDSSESFDFESELDNFTLNKKPALTFSSNNEAEIGEDSRVERPNFNSELVFDPATGTFKTELRQSISESQSFSVSQDSAHLSQTTQPTIRPVTQTSFPSPSPSPSPFTAFASQTPTASPAPTASPSPVSFTPLNFPSPSNPPTTVASSQAPRTTATPAVFSSFPSPSPSPTPSTPVTSFPTQSNTPSESFFFQPASNSPTASPSTPFSAPTSSQQGLSSPTSFAQPTPFPQQTTAAQQQQVLFAQQQQQLQQNSLSGQRGFDQFPQQQTFPTSSPSNTFAPTTQSAQGSPSIQFGFQPIQQQQQQQLQQQQQPTTVSQTPSARPFTAFANGLPPQLSGQTRQPFFSQPQQQFPQQQFRPQQQQQQQQQIPFRTQQQQPLQSARFNPQARPQNQPSGSFSIFNPNAFNRATRF